MVGLINGSDRYPLGSGISIAIAQVIEKSIGVKEGIVLEKRTDESSRNWSISINDLGPDPSSDHGSSACRDYKGLFWQRAGLFALAGWSRVILLDNASGAILREQELEFFGKSSLDVLQFILSPSEHVMVVVSSFLVVAFDHTSSLRWKWEPQTLIAGVAAVGSAGFVLNRYDFETPKAAAYIQEHLQY